MVRRGDDCTGEDRLSERYLKQFKERKDALKEYNKDCNLRAALWYVKS